MLVLTRKLLEKIQVGENITIQVLAIDPGRVRLGLTAPDDVAIIRTELLAPPLPGKGKRHDG
jgi:carbon storage regulator